MIIAATDLLTSNAVYYPCFDPAYPTPNWKTDLRLLPLLFDYVIVPTSHILENASALAAVSDLAALYRNGICIGSIRMGQTSLQEFFLSKAEELGPRLSSDQEEAFQSHAANYRVLFHRDTESQSAAFRNQFVSELTQKPMNQQEDELLSRLPVHGIHLLHREQLDELIAEVASADVLWRSRKWTHLCSTEWTLLLS